MPTGNTNVQVTLRGRYDASLQRAIDLADRGMDRLNDLVLRVNSHLKWVGAAAAAAAVAVAKVGVGFNAQLESATISLGAMLSQLAPDRFATLEEGLGASRRMIRDLRLEAMLTTATFKDLLEATQGLVGPALQAGVPVEQIPALVAMISRTVSTVMPGAPGYQLMQEGRALLTGRIDQSAFVAKTLGISGDEIKAASQSGRLMEFLTERMERFNEASELAAGTLQGLASNLQDVFTEAAAANTGELFERIKSFLVVLKDVVGSPEFSRSLAVLQGAAIGLMDQGGTTGKLGLSALANLPGFMFDQQLMPDEQSPVLARLFRRLFWAAVESSSAEDVGMSTAQTAASAIGLKPPTAQDEDDWMAFWFEESARALGRRKERLSAALDMSVPQSSMARFGLFAGRGEQTLQQMMQHTLKNQLGELQKINRRLETGIRIEEPSV